MLTDSCTCKVTGSLDSQAVWDPSQFMTYETPKLGLPGKHALGLCSQEMLGKIFTARGQKQSIFQEGQIIEIDQPKKGNWSLIVLHYAKSIAQ